MLNGFENNFYVISTRKKLPTYNNYLENLKDLSNYKQLQIMLNYLII